MALVTANDLLLPGRLNEFSVGAFLGFEWTPQQVSIANDNAMRFFQELSVIPSRHTIVECPHQMVYPNGVITACGRRMTHTQDERRKLGFRFRCRGIIHERVDFLKFSYYQI